MSSDNVIPESLEDPSLPRRSVIEMFVGSLFYPFEFIGGLFKSFTVNLRGIFVPQEHRRTRDKPLFQRVVNAVTAGALFIGGSFLGGFAIVSAKLIAGPYAILTGVSYIWSVIVAGKIFSRLFGSKTAKKARRFKKKKRQSKESEKTHLSEGDLGLESD